MKFLRLILIGIVLPFAVSAQSNYKAGYIIKSQGDTIKGYINYREWSNSPNYIDFKTNLTDKPAKVYPVDLRGFEVTGLDKYVSYTGLVSIDKNIFPDLPYALDTSVVNDTLFLQVCYQGKPLSLLKQTDNLKTRFFVSDNNAQPVELKFYQYYINTSAYPIKAFTALLKELAQKYNPQSTGINNTIEQAAFRESDLTKVLKQINNDQSKAAPGNAGGRFFAGLLLARTITQFEGDNTFSGIKHTSYTPRLSAGYDVFLNKNTQKFYIRAELSGTYIKPRFTKEYNSVMPARSYEFDQYTLSLTPQLVYNVYNTQIIKAYINIGASVNYSFYSKNTLISKTSVSDPSSEIRVKDYYGLETLWMNFPVQAGITLNKKIDIYALYMHPTAYTTYLSFSLSSTIYGIGIRYLLTAK